jgi:uncharacterized protein (DUF2235 family)
MPRNIIIFSDGTGQAGGLQFDEKRSNIYKLFRATRNGPDSPIDPKSQLTFYDPGLGTNADDNGRVFGGLVRDIYNIVSQATGLGITANIIDCYAALIRLWRPGDRIFLFGFSRGAYTIRCLAGVIAQCGIPTRLSETEALKYDDASIHELASQAVRNVYQFTESRQAKDANSKQQFLLDTRAKIAARFRLQHASGDAETANVYPYFIGAFDTVASLTNKPKATSIALAYLAAIAVASLAASYLSYFPAAPLIGGFLAQLSFAHIFRFLLLASIAAAAGIYLKSHLKFDFKIPGYSREDSWRTVHLTEFWQNFYDYELNEHVAYAKHALSIDENRKDFARVKWTPSTKIGTRKDALGNINFEQVWFAGNHSDIGGSYLETEARLSDISLNWMINRATEIPDGLRLDPGVLRVFPDPAGMQHDEVKAGLGTLTTWLHLTWPVGYRKPAAGAIIHRSVYERFDLNEVFLFDNYGPYRPEALREHKDFAAYYVAGGAFPACSLKQSSCVAREPEAAKRT